MAESRKVRRVYQVAKELNISHDEIITFLNGKGIDCQNHMSKISEKTYELLLEEFATEKDQIERYRKEKARRELEQARRREQELREKAEQERARLNDFAISMVEKHFPVAILEIEEISKQYAQELIPEIKPPEPEPTEVEEIVETVEVEEVTSEKGELPPSKKKKKKAKKSTEEAEAEILPKGKKVLKKKKKKHKKGKRFKEGDILEEIADMVGDDGKGGRKMRRIDISEIEAKLEERGRRRKRDKGKEGGKRREEIEIDERKIEDTIKKTMAMMDERSRRRKKHKKVARDEEGESEKQRIKISEYITVEELANLMDVDPSEVIQKCLGLGILATINQRLDVETAVLIADEFGYEVEQVVEYAEDLFQLDETEEDLRNAKPRAPVITIMGHVDHGKTSLLDYIRNTNVVAGEIGSITQKIGAYRVNFKGREITFIDTPGHEAFTSMRARGAQVTDIVVLVVAADDSVMPQTVEAIHHAKAANVPIIVAINKIDKPEADPERVRRELAEHDLLVEDWGGKYQCSEISAKTGQGVEELMEKILLEADLMELKANYDTYAKGTVLEAKLSKRFGPLATILVQKGTLHIGDPFVCGETWGKVRMLMNEREQRIKEAIPSMPVLVTGFSNVPQVGDILAVMVDEKEAKKIGYARARIKQERQLRRMQALTLDSISQQIARGEIKELPIIIKADTDGSVEAIYEAVRNLGNEEISIHVVHYATGRITESDVMLASASNAIIIGFQVAPTAKAIELAKQENVEIREYSIIYDLTNDLKLTLEGLLEPEVAEEEIGEAEVRAVFKVPKIGFIAGCYVTSGRVLRNAMAKVKRDGEVVHKARIISLKRFKEDVREVAEGFECGIALEDFQDYKEGDKLLIYEEKQIQRQLS